MENSSSPQSIVARAAEAFAQELPRGERRTELQSLVRTLDQPSEKSQQWTKSFSHGLEAHRGQTALGLWMDHAARESQVRSRRSRAWIYPLFVAGVAFVVMAFLSPFVINTFQQMFREFGLKLPAPTIVVFYISENIFGDPIQLLVAVLILITVGYSTIHLITRFSLLSRYFNGLVAGNNGSVSAMASFTGMLAHLLGAGMPLPDALEESGQACGHNYLASVGNQLAQHVRDNKGPLAQAAVASRLPRNVIDALQPINCQSPNLGLLRELSTLYEERVTARTEWAGGAIGVIGIVVVGCLVLFVVLALFMPLVELIFGLTR